MPNSQKKFSTSISTAALAFPVRAEALSDIDSPALLLFPERVEENIRRTIALAGGAANLRPHIKTHKCAEILQLQLSAGISKFKCATIAECELAAASGARDILLAYQPAGPRIKRFTQLLETFPKTRFSCLADNAFSLDELARASTPKTGPLRVFLDIDCGQQRSGITPGGDALQLYLNAATNPALEMCGLHAYDGHIHDSDVNARQRHCDESFLPVEVLRDALIAKGLPAPQIVAGGTPTFPFHAKRAGVDCSPGTNILWDAGYAEHFPDLDFQFAACVLTRVVSKPAANRLCLDLGHKSIASESPHPRVIFPQLPEAEVLMHNEEHLVLETTDAAQFPIGAALLGIPWHICPTVALHQEFVVFKNGMPCERWRIAARDRRIAI